MSRDGAPATLVARELVRYEAPGTQIIPVRKRR
jgi:hypothetical protein